MEKPRFLTNNVINGIVITCIVLFVLAFVLPSAWAIYSFKQSLGPAQTQEQYEKTMAEEATRLNLLPATSTTEVTVPKNLDLLQPIRTAFIDSGVLPKDTAITRVHELAENRYLATLERTDETTNNRTVELWTLVPETKKATKISEFTSLEAGLDVTISTDYYDGGLHVSFMDAWEGWNVREDVYVDKDGSLVAKTKNEIQLDFTVTNAKGETIKIASDGQTCAGKELTSETSSSLITKLIVNDKPFTLKKPFTMNCSANELIGVHSAALFTEANLGHADVNGVRKIYLPIYQAYQNLVISIDKTGTMTVSQ